MAAHLAACLLALLISDFSSYDSILSFLEDSGSRSNQGFHDIINGPALGAVLRLLGPSSPLLTPILSLAESLITKNHWNAVQVYDQGLVSILLAWLHAEQDHFASRDVILQLIKRVMEVGTSANDLASLVHLVSGDGETVDATYLSLLRHVVRPKWPCHFALRKAASLAMQSGIVSNAPTDFTLLVSIHDLVLN